MHKRAGGEKVNIQYVRISTNVLIFRIGYTQDDITPIACNPITHIHTTAKVHLVLLCSKTALDFSLFVLVCLSAFVTYACFYFHFTMAYTTVHDNLNISV